MTGHTPQSGVDTRMVGYHFPEGAYKNKTPLDFRVDPETGIREGQNGGAWAVSKSDVREGIMGATLPPLFIWKEGRWLTDFEETQEPIYAVRVDGKFGKKAEEDLARDVWVVHGEGTPGDFVFRAYLLPKKYTDLQVPPHPMLWDEEFRKGKSGMFSASTRFPWDSRPTYPFAVYHASWDLLDTGSRDELHTYKSPDELAKPQTTYGYGYPTTDKTKPVVSVPASKAPTTSSLPLGVRIRHLCGHWFKESELPGHAKVCPFVSGDTDADWALLCDDKCGCEMIKGFPTENHALGHKTLDHVSRCKPGYEPKPKLKEVSSPAEQDGEATSPSTETTSSSTTSSESSDSNNPQEEK